MTVAGVGDVGAIAGLRARWGGEVAPDPGFERRLAAWLAAEGDRRTTWLATLGERPVGMTSMLEYRRMPRPGHPDARWGYVANLFVDAGVRNRGIGATLLTTVVTTADARRYVRLVLSPSAQALSLYRRLGFIVPDAAAGDDRLLVRPGRRRPG